MALDFNIEPFYDDYSEDKQFYRILFRPGYAIQARELTQLQTILQQQIKRQGDHLFKKGAMVIPGQISYDSKTPYVKLKTYISSSATTKTYSVLSTITGKIYQGTTSQVRAIILASTPAEIVAGVAQSDTIFVKYIRGTGSFIAGEVISPVDGSTGLDLQVEDQTISTIAATSMVIGTAYTIATIGTTDFTSFGAVENIIGTPFIAAAIGSGSGTVYAVGSAVLGFGTTVSIEQGVYYIKDNFVLVQPQTIILSKYNRAPSAKVGLQVNEQVIYPEDDETLLDNALGSPNYAAPGAARYYIDLQLVSKEYSATVDNDEFITLLTVKSGNIQFIVNKTEYAEIEKTLARRTYDESGDYTVRDFPIQIREYRNNDRGTWTNNNTYIKGDVILSSGAYYKCTLDHTSASSGAFSNTNWLADTTPPFNYGLNQGPTYTTNISSDITPLTEQISLTIEPGKAYVRGYEIEKTATQYYTLRKARTTNSIVETKTIDTSPGNYVIIKDPKFLPSINTDVTFYNKYGTAGSVPTGSPAIVGTARVKEIQQHSVSPLQYKVFLFNVSITSPYVFSRDAKYMYSSNGFSGKIVPTSVSLVGTLTNNGSSTTVTGVNTTFIADLKQYDYVSIAGVEYQILNTVASNNSIVIDTATSIPTGTTISRVEATIYEPDSIYSYYALPRYATASTQNLNYSFYKSAITTSGTSFGITETGYTFGAKTDTKNYIVTDSSGVHLTYVSSGPTTGQFTLTGDATSSATFTFGTSGVYTIIYNLRKSVDGSSPRLKTLTNYTETITVSSGVLSKADGLELISITSAGTDVTSKFKFDNGLKPSHYELCSISLLPGQTVTGSVVVTYSYFSPGSTGDYFSINSYTHASSNITYNEVPAERRNIIDFRPLKTDATTFSSVVIPKYAEESEIDYFYYLGRIDKLCLDNTGNFIIIEGIPSINPQVPASPKNSMDLYTFNIEPYTFNGTTASIIPNKIENKRYTMRDIGKLENRISNLEYYTSLSLLEQKTINNRAYDNYGFERPQNGFMVDDFSGQGIGNVTSSDWKASIDTKAGELRPFITQTNITLTENIGSTLTRDGRNYVVNGDLVTLKIASTTPLVYQPRASHSESVNPFNVYTFFGKLELNPWNDTWFETNRKPDVIINDTSKYDALVNKSQQDGILGTLYKSWQTVWASETLVHEWTEDDWNQSLSTTYGTFAQSGITTFSGGTNTSISSTITDSIIDDKVVSTDIIPYIRSRKIAFRGDGFKPQTSLYAFFDNISVDNYIIPAKVMVVTGYGTSTVPTFAVNVNVGSNINNVNRKVISSDAAVTAGSFVVGQTYSITTIGTTNFTLIGASANTIGLLFNASAIGSGTGTATSVGVTTSYSYGEVLNEYVQVSGGVPTLTGVSCIVLGQETYGSTYLYVDNIQGGSFSSDVGNNVYYLQAEFDASRKVKCVSIATPNSIVSSYTGKLFGVFNIPNTSSMSFRTGTRQLRFTNNAQNSSINEATSAQTDYVAKGSLQTKEKTILSTKTGELAIEVIGNRTQSTSSNVTRITSQNALVAPVALVDSGDGIGTITYYTGVAYEDGYTDWGGNQPSGAWASCEEDPLAQTFVVAGVSTGAFITDIDLFFSAKDDSVPLKIQIRNVVNGYPGPYVLPYSEVIKDNSNVYISDDASIATNFKFISPIYLQAGVEYALIVMSGSAKYKAWVAQCGEADINGSGLISEQPYIGSLFKSQNGSTWTADQNQDLKFTINRAVFDTSSTASLTLVNQNANSDVYYDLANININKIVLPNTKVTAKLNNVNATTNNNIDIELDENTEFDQEQKLKDYVEEAGTYSFSTTLTLSSTKSNLSPVIDIGRCSATLVQNIIDNAGSDGETTPEIGIASAKYATKQVRLTQPASHLRILFDANIPNDASINLYYKTGLQSTNFNNVAYTLMSDSAFIKKYVKTTNSREFYEVETRLDLSDFDIIQVKIVMKSTNSAKVPRVKALRVITYA